MSELEIKKNSFFLNLKVILKRKKESNRRNCMENANSFNYIKLLNVKKSTHINGKTNRLGSFLSKYEKEIIYNLSM